MKVLISWLAFDHDFIENEQGGLDVNYDGTTFSFHKNFYNHDAHVILYRDPDSSNQLNSRLRTMQLVDRLKQEFPDRCIETVPMNIKDPINVSEILGKISAKISEYSEHDIEVFISPGTPAMQVVWYLLSNSFELKLLQTRPGRFTEDGKPELIQVEIDESMTPISAVIHNSQLKKLTSLEIDNYILTPSIKKVYDKAKLVAHTDKVTTLILGESGVGKENLAHYIHSNSARSKDPFIKINCSAFSDQLLESRLFGYVKGAFTGAEKDTEGLFDAANNGTIFLDEIGDISPYMQQVLLRVLQEGEISPVGSNKVKKVDVRIISATNKNLVEMCEKEDFRWDLYYRLAVVELRLPPLRYRGVKEVRQLIDFFLKKLQKDLKRKVRLKASKEAMEVLLNYTYPGNVREMINILSRLYVFNDSEISKDDLPEYMYEKDRKNMWSMEEVEKEHIQKALNFFKGNQNQTRKHLKISPNTLRSKIVKYNLKVPK